jgi:Uma2 family endonuclease
MSTTPAAADAVPAPAAIASVAGISRRLWTRDEYYRLAEQGFLAERGFELVGGEIVEMAPQGFSHFSATDIVADLIRRKLGDRFWVRQQGPLAVDDLSDLEPDVSVVAGSVRDFSKAHPTTARLVVEIAKTSLEYDTQIKPALYAKANVPEYWVLDLGNSQLLVHRDPVADETAASGSRYKTLITLGKDDKVTPLVGAGVVIVVSEMLP